MKTLLGAAVYLGVAILGVPGSSMTGCGASIQAIYEGDVRFERCMALDAQPSINNAIRRECWMQWVTYYTYGQTRDRVLHAQLRIQQLSDTPHVHDGNHVNARPPASDSEEPLPQLGKSRAPEVDAARVEACEAECRRVHVDCTTACSQAGAGASCRPGCDAGIRSCREQCR